MIYISYFVQESPEGRKMMEFRRSLPAYKEKDALLTAFARNQVCQFLFLLTSCMTQHYVDFFNMKLQVKDYRRDKQGSCRLTI